MQMALFQRNQDSKPISKDTRDIWQELEDIRQQLIIAAKHLKNLPEREALADSFGELNSALTESIHKSEHTLAADIDSLCSVMGVQAEKSKQTQGGLNQIYDELRTHGDHLQKLTLILEEERRKCDQREARQAAEDQKLLNMVQSVIRYRDQLTIQLGYARESQVSQAENLLRAALDGTRSILTENGVEVLDGGGQFNEKFHRAVSTLPTEEPALHLQIASTENAGYRMEDRLIRSQEVTVYQYSPKSSQ